MNGEGLWLEAINLGFAYHQVVLEGIDLSLQPGELLALLGPNGAGKTTLLKLLAGLLQPSHGQVKHPNGTKAGAVAYLAQSEPLPNDFTVREIVSLGRLPHQGFWGRETPLDLQACQQAMQQTDTAQFANRRVESLSGGERQRVALARALAQQPRWLLLDEPTNHLDLAHQTGLIGLLRQQAKAGLGVVMVVHDLNLAAMADRCALLERGRLKALGPPSEVLKPTTLEQVYGLELETLRTSNGRVVIVPRMP